MKDLVLPWPDRTLHPNARVHWAKLAAAKKVARKYAHLATISACWHLATLPDGRLHLWIDFYPPDRRRRDDDGLLSSMKAARDGIADALGIDDHRFVSHPYVKDEIRKGGEVRIRITGGPSEPSSLPDKRELPTKLDCVATDGCKIGIETRGN